LGLQIYGNWEYNIAVKKEKCKGKAIPVTDREGP
jgi:hypothetical protein